MKTVYELFMQGFISQENKHGFPDGWAKKQAEEMTRDEFLMSLSDAIELRLTSNESESFDRNASHMAGKYVAYKDLKDAEIEEIYKKVYEEGHQNQVVALGRAILRKASEK